MGEKDRAPRTLSPVAATAALKGRAFLRRRAAYHGAMIRLIEYAPFSEIRRLLPRDSFIEAWPRLAPAIRSSARRQGMEFFRDWILGKRHLD